MCREAAVCPFRLGVPSGPTMHSEASVGGSLPLALLLLGVQEQWVLLAPHMNTRFPSHMGSVLS